jgi:hypothetical protein
VGEELSRGATGTGGCTAALTEKSVFLGSELDGAEVAFSGGRYCGAAPSACLAPISSEALVCESGEMEGTGVCDSAGGGTDTGTTTGLSTPAKAGSEVSTGDAETESSFFNVPFAWNLFSATAPWLACFSDSALSCSDASKTSAKLATKVDASIPDAPRAARNGEMGVVEVWAEAAIVLDTSTLVSFRSRTPESIRGTRLPQWNNRRHFRYGVVFQSFREKLKF